MLLDMSQPKDQTSSSGGSVSSDELSTESPTRGSTTRRRLLAAGAATWATVLAGCSGNGDDGDDNNTGDSDGSSAQPENFVVTAETGTGSEGVPESAQFASSCSATRRFIPGMQVIFYVGIYDPDTGDQLTDEDLSSVNVNVDGGETVELGWAGDDEENPAQEWAGAWTVPEDTEPGSISYTVEVSNGDANYRSVGILENSIEIIEYADPTNYVVTTNTYWDGSAPEDYGDGFIGSCSPERQFSQEMDVTFVIGVWDSATGEQVGSDGLDSVTISSTDGAFSDVELSWQADTEEEDPQWYGALETEDLEPGTYGYEVMVTNSGSDFHNVGIATNQFSIVEV